MFQPVQTETQSERQGLTRLHGPAAAWRTSRKFTFDRREYAFDQSAASVGSLRKGPSHLGAHSVDAPSFLSRLTGITLCAPSCCRM
jgi:hypothetical protein